MPELIYFVYDRSEWRNITQLLTDLIVPSFLRRKLAGADAGLFQVPSPSRVAPRQLPGHFLRAKENFLKAMSTRLLYNMAGRTKSFPPGVI